MIIYKVTINKPFDYDDPQGKFCKGDVGIYSKHIKQAIKDKAILEITTPLGVTYADPKKIVKAKRFIYRYYKRPDEPMLLYIVTPKYNNKSDFVYEEPEPINSFVGLAGMPDKYRMAIRAKLGLR